jgi:hypothetical protein
MQPEEHPGHPGNVYEYLGEVGITAAKATDAARISMDSDQTAMVYAQVALANAIAGLAAAIHQHGEQGR